MKYYSVLDVFLTLIVIVFFTSSCKIEISKGSISVDFDDVSSFASTAVVEAEDFGQTFATEVSDTAPGIVTTAKSVAGQAEQIAGTIVSQSDDVVQTTVAQVADAIAGETRTPFPFSSPVARGTAQNSLNSLNIRIDSVKILEDGKDFSSGSEVFFAILVKRDFGESARLILPGEGTYQAIVGEEIMIGDFSLNINNVKEDERITVFFMGFDSDDNFGNEAYLDLGLGILSEAVEDVLTNPASNALKRYILGHTTGKTLEWWQNADVLGDGYFILDYTNNWLIGESYSVKSPNENLEVTFSIIPSSRE